MRKFLCILLCLAFFSFAAASCGKTGSGEPDADNDQSGRPAFDYDSASDARTDDDGNAEIVYVAGDAGLGEKDRAAIDGVKMFASRNGKTYKYAVPENGEITAMKAACANGAKVVVMHASEAKTGLYRLCEEYADVLFIVLDAETPAADAYSAENLVYVTLSEFDRGYLAGYAAVANGAAHIGFCGKEALEEGFLAGAGKAAEKRGVDVTVDVILDAENRESDELVAVFNGWYQTGTQIIVAEDSPEEAASAAASSGGKLIFAEKTEISDTVAACVYFDMRAALDVILSRAYSQSGLSGSVTLGAADGCAVIDTDKNYFTDFSSEEVDFTLSNSDTFYVRVQQY